MIRLILLLMGAGPLRKYWWVIATLSCLCLVLGLIFIADLFDTAIIITTDVIGLLFIIEGAVRLLALAAIGFPNATIPVLKALGFFALGFMAVDIPWDDNIVATIVLGAALVFDGIFRWAGAALIRSVRWRQAVLVGLFEVIIGVLVWAPWPVPHRQTVPFCIGVALIAAAWSLARLSVQLRRLKIGASVTDLPLFAGPNWHARGILHPSHEQPTSWNNEQGLTVHVWTPIGSAVNPQRRFLIDRYVAAIDQGGVISTGHAAMSLAPNIYVSLCPADDMDHSPEEFGRLLRAGPENNVPGRFRSSFEEECASWRCPDQEVVFHRYNSASVRAFLASYQAEPIYNLTNRNCSSTVALSLDAAVEGALGQERPWKQLFLLLTDPAMWLLALWRARAEAMTWTPGLILDYAQTLQHIIEGRRERWLVRLRETRKRYVRQRRALVEEGQPTRSSFPAIISLVMTGLIFGLSYGLSAPLLALNLTQMGFDESSIGANAAMHAVGVLVAAPLLPRLAWRVGPKLPITAALLAAGAILALFPIAPSVLWWFPLRLALGVASETMFVMSETWLSQLSDESNRTRTMATYTASLSLGFALGPMILTVVGAQGPTPFLIAGGIALVALLTVAMPWVRAPAFERPSHTNPFRYVALAPLALLAALVNAALETAGMSFLPLYAMRLGWDQQSATMLLSVLLLGAIVLQLPIGWLGDQMDRRKLVVGLALASTIGALIWPYAIGTPLLAYALLFLWGGLFVGIYTVMMALIGSRFQGADLVSIYAVLSLSWGVGAFVGPSAAGLAMDLTLHGLPYVAAAACAAFAILAILRRSGT
ncbi:MFS transporter [Labrys sp. ZIDIC5]|uniref:MFS transporter n=1 Tax=Labrys sedimenti TaxID=3106036 RepID=UPI002ACA2DF6|nr:MFS transporter [Labrys sp. ZIDIC5]MDZ5454670.1 MFS transporter [Labrys sp. ZIDIC5]